MPMTEAEAVNWAFKQILDPQSTIKPPTPAALAVCAAYERALTDFETSQRMVLPSFLMAALEMLCKECGR